MKKLILLLATGAFASSANAQSVTPSLVNKQAKIAVEDYGKLTLPAKKGTPGYKTTVGGSRWYIPFDMLDDALYFDALENTLAAAPIWFDSTVRQRFNTGLGTINYSSVAQVVDPISTPALFNSVALYPGEIQVASTNQYRVDSVMISGIYQRVKTGIVDTLIISIAANNLSWIWSKSSPNNAWTAAYIPTNDTLRGIAPTKVDSVRRAIFTDVATATEKTWKVPLVGDVQGTTALTIQDFSFAVPGGGYNVPAGSRVAVSFTFKSGDTWVANVDSFASMNNFRAIFGEAVQGGQMPYKYYSDQDRNGSSLMFSTDTSFYAPSVAIEGTNTTAFRYEFLRAGVFVVCSTCNINSISDVNGLISDANAFPNPANTEVNIPFSLKESANVNVTITNTVGQVIKSQNFGKVATGKATFTTSDLAGGVYFYTVEANGQRSTGRFVVAH